MPDVLDCPRMECWQALFNDTVSPDERERNERHLESCPACQERLDQANECEETMRTLVRRVGNLTALAHETVVPPILDRLCEVRSPLSATSGEPPDLYFLQPTDRPDILGTLGAYEVEAVIGQGGMGIVLKAFEPALHRLVAIKVLAPAVAGSATARQRFKREAQAAAAVCHDHIVAVHGVHEKDGLPYLVMQYIAGESLQARLDRTGPLELVEIVRIGLQTASGLAAAHAQGLIHRDIKPANLLLEDGLARVRITDFGLARMIDDVPLTRNGELAGTPEYMAPEQARGEPVDHRADLFSLGSVLYALCTGRQPFRGSSIMAVLRQVSEETPPPIRSLNPDIPAWLDAFIARLMAKNPAERLQSAAEVAALLETYLAHLRQPATVPVPKLPLSSLAGLPRRLLMHPQMSARKWFLVTAAGVVSLLSLLGIIAASVFKNADAGSLNLGGTGGSVFRSGETKSLEPRDGLVCLLVNKNSGRCLSVAGGATDPGAKIVQGPKPEQAGAAERWLLLGTGKAFRLRNENSHLVLEIGSANLAPGVQAVQWHDQPPKANQLWTFERIEDEYVLRAEHSQLVLGIGQSSLEEGARAIQWNCVADCQDQHWELRPIEQPKTLLEKAYYDFRGRPLPPEMEQFGPVADQFVKMEAEGLHITLPKDRNDLAAFVGVSLPVAIKGDFEITTTFEVLQAETPTAGYGVGMLLALNKTWRLGRYVRPNGEPVIVWGRWKQVEGKRQLEGQAFPCTAQMGRLRVTRTGMTLHYLWSPETAGDDFNEIHQGEFGTEDITLIQLLGETSRQSCNLDVRWLDLRIRDRIPAVEAKSSGPEKALSRSGQVVAELLGLGTVLFLLITWGVWLYVRRRRLETPALPVAVASAPTTPATPAIIAFACSVCGKNLKAKAELAGKKVKCTQCSQAALVPSIQTNGAAASAKGP